MGMSAAAAIPAAHTIERPMSTSRTRGASVETIREAHPSVDSAGGSSCRRALPRNDFNEIASSAGSNKTVQRKRKPRAIPAAIPKLRSTGRSDSAVDENPIIVVTAFRSVASPIRSAVSNSASRSTP